MQEIIKLENVHKDYKMGETKIHAVEAVDLTIKKGDFIAIIGPSGSGKSTMMNLVGALDIANEGDIFLGNQNIEHLHESELAQVRGKKIGFIFQTFNLIPTLTALENVMLPMVFQNVHLTERRKRAEEIAKESGLDEIVAHTITAEYEEYVKEMLLKSGYFIYDNNMAIKKI